MNRLLAAAPLLLILPAAGPSLPIQPGKWQSTVTILDMQSPHMRPGAGAGMRAHPTTVSACVTAAQAADGPRAVLQGSHGKCHYTSFNASGGRFSTVMQCLWPEHDDRDLERHLHRDHDGCDWQLVHNRADADDDQIAHGRPADRRLLTFNRRRS